MISRTTSNFFMEKVQLTVTFDFAISVLKLYHDLEFTVEGILMVADMYDTPLVIRKCEEFLLEKSKKTLKKKLQMSMKYHLEALNVFVSL